MGELEEEIYMKNLEDVLFQVKNLMFINFSNCKQWHEKFNQILVNNGFSSLEVDKCADNMFKINSVSTGIKLK